MVSFLKLPFKFRQVIYLTSQVFFPFFYEGRAWIDYEGLHSFLPDIFRCLTTAFFFGPALTEPLFYALVWFSVRGSSGCCLAQARAAAHWGWGRAVNLPTFLEVTVEAAPQAGQEVLAQIPILPPASTMIQKFAFFPK